MTCDVRDDREYSVNNGDIGKAIRRGLTLASFIIPDISRFERNHFASWTTDPFGKVDLVESCERPVSSKGILFG